MMTSDEFNLGFNYLVGHFPNTKNLKSVSYAYFEDLKEVLTGKEFIVAIKKIIRSGKSEFIPKVKEIIDVAKGNANLETQVIQAKKLLKLGIAKCGRSGNTCFEDKGIHAVIEAVGWLNLCNMSDKEASNFFDFQFEGIYKDFYNNPYETQDYYRGSYQVFGREKPKMLTYEMIGVKNTGNMNFIPLEYKNNTVQIENKVDLSKIKNKMLIGG